MADNDEERPDFYLEKVFSDLTAQNKWKLFQDEMECKNLIDVILKNLKRINKSMDVLIDERDAINVKCKEVSKQNRDLQKNYDSTQVMVQNLRNENELIEEKLDY